MYHQTPMTCTYGYGNFIHFKTVATEMEIKFLSTLISLLPQFGSAFPLLKKGVSQYFFFHIMNAQVIGDLFLAQGLLLKTHQR